MGGTHDVCGNATREVCFNGVDGIYYGSAHIQPIKQKTRIAPFLLPNVERGLSVLKKKLEPSRSTPMALQPNTTLENWHIIYMKKRVW
jgi:hypothetical protein